MSYYICTYVYHIPQFLHTLILSCTHVNILLPIHIHVFPYSFNQSAVHLQTMREVRHSTLIFPSLSLSPASFSPSLTLTCSPSLDLSLPPSLPPQVRFSSLSALSLRASLVSSVVLAMGSHNSLYSTSYRHLQHIFLAIFERLGRYGTPSLLPSLLLLSLSSSISPSLPLSAHLISIPFLSLLPSPLPTSLFQSSPR